VPFESVEDTIQEVFLRVYRSLPTFRNESSLRHWLSVIATRTCYDYWREHYKSKEMPISSLTEQHQAWLDEALAEERDMSLQAKALRKEAGEILDIALNSLSAGDKMVVELVYLEEYSLKEAAKLLGWTVANVKVRLFRSRKKLHKLLTSRDKDEGSKT
jgi:RNA polymerase sigma-70 factor (ECF subfamily)